MEQLANLIDAILAMGIRNEIRASIFRDERGWIRIVIVDNYSEFVNVYEAFLEKALTEAVKQLQEFVDEQAAAAGEGE